MANSTDPTGVTLVERGKGYGRQMLGQVVAQLRGEDWDRIRIEVATDNRNALGLYLSRGFEIRQTYGFYHLP